MDPKASSKLMKQSMGAQLPPEMEVARTLVLHRTCGSSGRAHCPWILFPQAAIPKNMREGFGALRSMMAVCLCIIVRHVPTACVRAYVCACVQEMSSSIPGIDEAISFAELMKYRAERLRFCPSHPLLLHH